MDALVEELRERFPRVAVVHEWLTVPGGSEKVTEAILELVPHAEVFCSVYDPAPFGPLVTERPVHPSFIQKIPGAVKQYPKLLPLMDTAFRRFDLSGFDLIVSSSHACAKNVRTPPGVPHVCYCHTPMRYAWDPEFLLQEDLGPVARAIVKPLTAYLRRVDLRGASGPTAIAANSAFVAGRVREWWHRDASVVHPPVDVARFLDRERRVGEDAPYLVFGRLVPYKRPDAAVEACRALGRPLVVAGDGRFMETVRAAAGDDPRIELRGRVSDAEADELMATCRALLFPGVEDFGIVPVEAQAAGMPVIAYGEGGARDSVRDGVTGVLYDDPSAAGLAAAIERFEGLSLDDAALRAHALEFAPEVFHERFGSLLLQDPTARPMKRDDELTATGDA
ncbi:MAG: glycosyltransferase [Solirubrobacteraceae bacterium]|nr:glycosyltransferase [Solirubrobacteraceae bacterium]